MFIAVHAGAGYHAPRREDEYKQLCKEACKKGMVLLKKGKSALEVVTVVVKHLEDSHLTNAGIGSNLTRNGSVECDAGIMESRNGVFGGVGAVRGVRNPISIAQQLVIEQDKEPHPLGLVTPMVLVGDGAEEWAKRHGIPSCSESDMMTKESIATYEKNLKKLEQYDKRKVEETCSHHSKRLKLQEDMCSGPLDTVGAVCVDAAGVTCAGASSGGMILKHPGRIGQACNYGAGCWASEGINCSVACCTSGCGEYLTKTFLAKECATDALSREDWQSVKQTLENKFLGSPVLASIDVKLAGVLLLKHEQPDDPGEYGHIDFTWGHTTPSMCIGYMNSEDKRPKAIISRLSSECSVGKTVHVEGVHWKNTQRK